MKKHLFDPELVSKIQTALDWELKLAGLYAEIANEMPDQSLQSLIYTLSGDAYGHLRTLAVFQALVEGLSEQHFALSKKPSQTSLASMKKPNRG